MSSLVAIVILTPIVCICLLRDLIGKVLVCLFIMSKGKRSTDTLLSSIAISLVVDGHVNPEVNENNESSKIEQFEMSLATEAKKKRFANRLYKRKLCFTICVVVCVIVVTWLLFIAPLCLGVYAILTSYGVIPDTRDLSTNTTLSRTFSNADSCPYNMTTAFAKYKVYTDWFNSIQSNSSLNTTYAIMIANTSCVDRFVNNNTQCSPECLKFAPGGDAYLIGWRVFIFTGSLVTLVVSVLGILTWIKIGGKLWSFPHIISFYLICLVLVHSVCILSGQIVPQRFYCKHASLLESRDDVTIQCNIQGGVYHYSIMVFLYWYLSAVVNLLYIVSSPINGAAKFQRYRHWIHLFESLFCWGVPLLVLIGTVVVLRGYRISNQPEFCHPNTTFVLITLYIPGLIFCLFNFTAVPIVISTLLQRRYKVHKMIGRGTDSLELVVQMTIFTIAFSFSIWMVMLSFSVNEFEASNYETYLEQYSRCVTIFGTKGDECCVPVYREYYYNGLGIASGFASTIWGLAGMSALANKDVRKLWKLILSCNNCCHGDK